MFEFTHCIYRYIEINDLSEILTDNIIEYTPDGSCNKLYEIEYHFKNTTQYYPEHEICGVSYDVEKDDWNWSTVLPYQLRIDRDNWDKIKEIVSSAVKTFDKNKIEKVYYRAPIGHGFYTKK